jgi:hypothetical protein
MIKNKHKKKLQKEFRSSHNLIFETAPFQYDPTVTRFRVGTCDGIYTVAPGAYVIIAVTNSEPGNGHLDDVLEWFERSCRREGYSLRIAEFQNMRFKKHLIEKLGFKPYGINDVEKVFTHNINQKK